MRRSIFNDQEAYEHILKRYGAKRLTAGTRPERGWSRERPSRIGAIVAGRDLQLVDRLKTFVPEHPELGVFLPKLEQALPPAPIRTRVDGGHHFVWFQRVVFGGAGSDQSPSLPLGIAVLCMEVTVTQDTLKPWIVDVTLVDAWRNPKPRRSIGYSGYSDEPDDFRQQLAAEVINALQPGLTGLYDFNYDKGDEDEIGYSDCVFSLIFPPDRPDLRALADEVGDCIKNLGDSGNFNTEALSHFFLIDPAASKNNYSENQVFVKVATAQHMEQIAQWQGSDNGRRKPKIEHGPVNHRHAVVIVRDRLLQRCPAGVVESRAPAISELDWVHWIFCVDMATSTFYVEPFIPSINPIDVLSFLQRAWGPKGDSVIKQRPAELELPKTVLNAASRRVLESELGKNGVALTSPKTGGGQALSVARVWISDTDNRDGQAPISSLQAVHDWAMDHLSLVLYSNLAPKKDEHEQTCRAIHAMQHGHYTSFSAIDYRAFCAAMGVDIQTEEERLVTAVKSEAAGGET